MRIGILTSSRADYGIYLPLLKALQADPFFDLHIIAFGTHLSPYHGYTLQQIERDGFRVGEKIESLVMGDSEEAIATAIGNTVVKFSSLWARLKGELDWVFALGDRYEMMAAVLASVPFNTEIAHLHGGETTLGAIDDKFRHCITLCSTLHFTATETYAAKVRQLLGSNEKVFNVGSLSLQNLTNLQLLNKAEFLDRFNIDLNQPTILCTFHPETISVEKNASYAETLARVFRKLTDRYQVVITMPNADTKGGTIRRIFTNLADGCKQIIVVENFGTLGYFSCMQHCAFLLGNTSSGIIEAASFNKYVINLGNRQQGRARSENVVDITISESDILESIRQLEVRGMVYEGENIYYNGQVTEDIIRVLKEQN